MNTYKPTIGIEVHAELKTQTKMFCDSKNDPHASEPNIHICPVCMGHPGTLPVINKRAVEHVLKVGLALGSNIATYTEFDRKNYFYPDIPKGYQISQYQYPLVAGGKLADVDITRVHLEEDTARSLHDQCEGSIVDYNRAGVPLMELVTEPVIHDAETAGTFARELQLLLRTLGVSDANMEKGEMRVEANISISKDDTLGTKVEVKNLNSFKSVEQAIAYEIKRQAEVLESGEKVIQETRGWDETKGKTFSQRVKESADDYRYFPDPDLPKLDLSVIDEFDQNKLRASLPELPSEKREKYEDIGLTREQINTIISQSITDTFFRELVTEHGNEKSMLKLMANYIVTDLIPLLQKEKYDISTLHSGPFAELILLVSEDTITSRVAKDLLPEVVFQGIKPKEEAEKRGLLQSNSEETLLPVVQSIIKEHGEVVAEFKAGKEASLKFLVGQGMKMTQGSANPKLLSELLAREIYQK